MLQGVPTTCPRTGRAGRSGYLFSAVFDKVGSSGLVNILHNQTFRDFPDFFVGGAQRRPLILRLAAHGAARQAQVRNPLWFLVFALPTKRIFAIL